MSQAAYETPFYRIALAGNPNVGKSTLFNVLTGGNQHVGNWPGKTVARLEGWFEHQGERFSLVDLPGIYSLSPFAPDEAVARDHILRGRPGLVINVVDATNLERNLYLTAQILETEVPLIIALNMQDLAESRGYGVDTERLTQLLGGTPVISTSATKGTGIGDLKNAIWTLTRDKDLNHALQEYVTTNGEPSVLSHCHS